MPARVKGSMTTVELTQDLGQTSLLLRQGASGQPTEHESEMLLSPSDMEGKGDF